MNGANTFGDRNRLNERIRFAILVLLFVAIVLFEWILGDRTRHVVGKHASRNTLSWSWPLDRYLDYTNSIGTPNKNEGKTRIVYLSNSHALTGGRIPLHLSSMLEILAPGKYEVLDISGAGIFIPDMLQRTASLLNYDVDVLLLGISYISFSNRMDLSMQAHSVRTFLKREIAPHLSAAYWFRHYDISLYLDTLFSHVLDLYRYREKIRNEWEKPLANWLRQHIDPKRIHALEVDTFRSWRFPDGYDRNLFQWRLYQVGRSKHMEDLSDLIELATNNNIHTLGFNLPVDWDKGIFKHDPEDAEKYQKELASLFQDRVSYIDYEEVFPKAYTTYDALHPTWHGARLHAFDLLIRLRDTGIINASDDALWQAFSAADTQDYAAMVNSEFIPLSPTELSRFRRFDIFEKSNALKLIRRLLNYPVGSAEDIQLLADLSYRSEYWNRTHKKLQDMTHESNLWQKAFQTEVNKSYNNSILFIELLKKIQQNRTRNFVIPDHSNATLLGKQQVMVENITMWLTKYRLKDGTELHILETTVGKAVFVDVYLPGNAPPYRRIDLLGDGSFIVVGTPYIFLLPPWLLSDEALQHLGV